ncbi:MAG: MerR family transcriptional regulator [Rhizobiales bacterium]|nr:MerR family transcriptional regulator [Hyphomicrobiales bacterium]
MRVGELSAATGVKIETIRYYETVGLVPTPERAENGRRVYDRTDVERLSFVRRARLMGFPLSDIKAFLALDTPRSGNETARAIAERQLAEVRARMCDLRALESVLATAVEECRAGRGPICPVVAAIQNRGG